MQPFLELLKRCAENHSFDSGDPDCKTVLDQLYRTHAESHEDDPPGIRDGFKELDALLENLPLTMPSSTCAVAFARHMSKRLSLMAFTTAHS